MDISDRRSDFYKDARLAGVVTTWASGDWSPAAIIAAEGRARAAVSLQDADDLLWLLLFLAKTVIERAGAVGHARPEEMVALWRWALVSHGRPEEGPAYPALSP